MTIEDHHLRESTKYKNFSTLLWIYKHQIRGTMLIVLAFSSFSSHAFVSTFVETQHLVHGLVCYNLWEIYISLCTDIST